MTGNSSENTAITTIIKRREIDPLLTKACELMVCYDKAMGCESCVLDVNGSPIEIPHKKKMNPVCELCRFCSTDSSGTRGKFEYPCAQMHREARTGAKRGSSFVYTCNAGFSFWISPLYAGGRHAGFLAAGKVLAISKEEAVTRFPSLRKISPKEILELLNRVPQKTHDEIEAMAGMLMLCATKLSVNPWDNVPAIRRKITANEKPAETKTELLQKENRDSSWAYFQDKERMLLAALRRGDKEDSSLILNEVLTIMQKTGPEDFGFLRLRIIELAVLLSRAAGAASDHEESYFRCFSRLRESETVEELTENLQLIIDSLSTKIFSYSGVRHALALRKAERFIWENYTRKISLKEIAAASELSAPYFSSIFKEEMGKNLSAYLNELRVEKAAGLLLETGFPLNEIAKSCGFEDQSWFSKIFKNRMGLSPGKFREQGNRKNHKKEKQ